MGKITVNLLPLSGVLTKKIWPPSDSVIDLAIDNPSPNPGAFQEGCTLR